MKKQKENSHEDITWTEMGQQNVQAKKVHCKRPYRSDASILSYLWNETIVEICMKS